MTVKEKLLKTGAKMSKFDDTLFIWRNEAKLHGFIGCHVDNFIYGGSVLFNEQVIDKIKEKFEISREDDCVFEYIGQDVKQTHSEITIYQQQYIDELLTTEIPVYQNKLDVLDSKEKNELKAIAGQNNYTNETRSGIWYM